LCTRQNQKTNSLQQLMLLRNLLNFDNKVKVVQLALF
jgi:hypothetical protein